MPGRHPHFTSPLFWHDRLDEALEDAREHQRRVMILHGRSTDSGSRLMVERTLAKEELVEYALDHFVMLASRVEAPEPAVEALLAGLPKREPLPVCLYLAADGRLVHATVNGRAPAVLLNDMLDAVSRP